MWVPLLRPIPRMRNGSQTPEATIRCWTGAYFNLTLLLCSNSTPTTQNARSICDMFLHIQHQDVYPHIQRPSDALNFTIQLGLMPFSTRDEGSVYNSLAHSDVVVNMIGKHYETKHIVPTRRADGTISRINYGMEEVNVTIPRMLARQAREAGVTCFIHLSGAF